MELFLYIIWNNAYKYKNKIINDLGECFDILKTIEITWSKEKFNQNLNRFYGKKLPPNSFKEKACGIGPFTLVIVEDKNPKYDYRKTTRGELEYVNINTFDKKSLYREWTVLKSGNNCIHGTNSPEETEHDLTLLLGICPEDFYKKRETIPGELHQDIVGADGWESLEQFFYVLNHTEKYVFLRNYENIPNSFNIEGHNDIDLLVDNYENVKILTQAKEVFNRKYRVQCICVIDNKEVQFDFRFVGDGYYDTNWEKKIINNRQFNGCVYIPSKEDYKYMILYHVLVHKREIAENYKESLNKMFGEKEWNVELLNKYMEDNKYKYSEPNDLSVYYNEKSINKRMSIIRKIRVKFRWLRWRFFNDKG